jgi:membrane fusion protein, multidrug efflux system
MTFPRRARLALFVLGALLAIGSLLGARALTNGHSKNGNGEQPKTANPAPPAKFTGPIVLGTVDSEPSPVPYLLPPLLQSGTVVKVFVETGKQVKVDDPLYEFDTALQKAKLGSAKAAVAMANTKVLSAREEVKKHTNRVEIAKKDVTIGETKKSLLANAYSIHESGLKATYKAQNYPEDTWPKRLKDDPNLYRASVDYTNADNELLLKKEQLAGLEAAEPEVLVREAEAGVDQAKALENEAQTAINLCTVRAKSAGTIERVTIGEGSTLGVGTREPALWLIPAGKRIVRAEVEADFAHRVGKDLEGKEVIIFDNTDPRLTYRGKVRHIPDTFLLKRSGGESLFGNDTRVLEVIVEIIDPAPAGQAPLRVGQRVRVGLGQ